MRLGKNYYERLRLKMTVLEKWNKKTVGLARRFSVFASCYFIIFKRPSFKGA